MKIEINVLPDVEKEKINKEKRIGFALKIASSFIAVLLILNFTLLCIQIILRIEYQALKRGSETATASGSERESELKKIFDSTNGQISRFSKTKETIPNWARVLVRISDMCPGGIRLNQLSVEENNLKVAGFSKTRDDFIDFQNKLKSEGFQFQTDISNLVASQNFNFELSLDIPKDYLIRD